MQMAEYISKSPRVVGEFDAAALHQSIDEAVASDPNISAIGVMQKFSQSSQSQTPYMEDIASINWAGLFNRRAFENRRSDGQIDEISYESSARTTSTNEWHPDVSSSNRYLILPEILTGASRWPTQFLLGRIAVEREDLEEMGVSDFWKSEAGRLAVERALTKGDAYTHEFEPGEVVKVPKGTLHRRNIPLGTEGFRYFMRHFPKHDIIRAGTARGRLRPSIYKMS